MPGSAYELGSPQDAEATGNGSMIAILKRIRTLLGGTSGSSLITGGYTAVQTFTPAAAGYSTNDVIDVAKSFTWLDRNGNTYGGGALVILSASIMVSETAVQSGETSYNLQKYSITPPSAHADNAAWDLPSGDRAAYQDVTALGTPVDLGSSLSVKTNGINEPILVPATGLTFAELVTVGAFTATATARKVTLYAVAL